MPYATFSSATTASLCMPPAASIFTSAATMIRTPPGVTWNSVTRRMSEISHICGENSGSPVSLLRCAITSSSVSTPEPIARTTFFAVSMV